MKPLISVIIPVYDVENYLSRCVESIRAQTYREIEILLVDDGSPDHCPEICDYYSGIDSRIVTLHKENGGQSSARNLGLDHAHGEYIAFVDSDDYVSPVFLEHMYKRIAEDKTDLAICDYATDKAGKITSGNNPVTGEGIIDIESLWELETQGYMYCVALWNKLFRASTWKNLRLKTGKYAEDSFAYTKYIKQMKTISVLHEELYYYVQRDNSLVHDYSLKNLDSAESRLERIDYFLNIKKTELARECLLNVFHFLFKATGRLNMSDPETKQRYTELFKEYRRLYRIAGYRPSFRRRYIASALFAAFGNSVVVPYRFYCRLRSH